MRILVNASNLKAGGGLQVADSFCRELKRFKQHLFIVVLSTRLLDTGKSIEAEDNIDVYYYDLHNNASTIVFGRDKYLDNLITEKQIEVALTVFGPPRWEPNCPHLCGFAMAFHVMPESPYYLRMGKMASIKSKIHNRIYEYFFQRKTTNFYTENPFISERLKRLFKGANVYTVTNYYNQVFDNPELWFQKTLPVSEGTTILTISNAYSHKNLEIMADISRLLKKHHPEFKFRFVISIDRDQYKTDISGFEDCFLFLGTVKIAECPSLYSQCDVVFQPTLLECFTATYPEAMRMERPIVTTDLEFARGLCGDAACYYSAVDPASAAAAIYHVATNKEFASLLVANGKEQLKKYDNYQERADKLISILETVASKKD